ncbi:MAG: amidohydrolase family protein, partial [Pseudomonadota bacterium]
ELKKVFEVTSEIGVLVGLHAEDPDMVANQTNAVIMGNDLQDYYASRADPVESKAVEHAIGILKHVEDARLHIVHLASAEALKHIVEAKENALEVTAETCPQYLAFTHEDFDKIGTSLKCAPVVKTPDDREALWKGLENGSIDFVATDHAPCTNEEKESDIIWNVYNGISGVQWRMPYLFSEGYVKGKITLSQLVAITSTRAAKRFGLYPRKGAIAVGSDADFVFIDPEKKTVVKGEEGFSKGKITPFENWTFTGKVMKTVVRGEVVYSIGEINMDYSYGKWIKRGYR